MAKHPHKHIRAAIRQAEKAGWQFQRAEAQERIFMVSCVAHFMVAMVAKLTSTPHRAIQKSMPVKSCAVSRIAPLVGISKVIHRFTILIPEADDELFDRIASQCPDSLSGMSAGKPYVDFSRESDSLGSAIDSAIADLTSIGVAPVGIQVREVASLV